MNRNFILPAILLCVIVFAGCQGGSNPVSTGTDPGLKVNEGMSNPTQSQTHLWGYYDVYIDPVNKTAVAVPNRDVMFTANVVKFLNGKPPKLSFFMQDIHPTPNYTDVDIDVSITHPFPGLLQYNGYDVRGVLMGSGSATLEYNSDLVYPVQDVDQTMLPDPIDGNGGPDGYTRWYNMPEFSEGGMPLFNYTQGAFASPGYSPTATLCPYKYYADSLTKKTDLTEWLNENPESHGIFSAGIQNTRNYYIRFPEPTGIKYAYAIIASWKGTEPEFHPANASEAVDCEVVDSSNVWYTGPSQNGGDIDLEISLWDWDSQVSAGVMEDYRIFIESTVLSSTHEFSDTEMIPIGGDENFSTYHVEIPADNITGVEGNEYWII
ncbi:MAG: hypothetical protein ABIC40_06465, partial [bacterium]